MWLILKLHQHFEKKNYKKWEWLKAPLDVGCGYFQRVVLHFVDGQYYDFGTSNLFWKKLIENMKFKFNQI